MPRLVQKCTSRLVALSAAPPANHLQCGRIEPRINCGCQPNDTPVSSASHTPSEGWMAGANPSTNRPAPYRPQPISAATRTIHDRPRLPYVCDVPRRKIGYRTPYSAARPTKITIAATMENQARPLNANVVIASAWNDTIPVTPLNIIDRRISETPAASSTADTWWSTVQSFR